MPILSQSRNSEPLEDFEAAAWMAAENHLLPFAVATHLDPIGYRINWHHRLMCRYLEKFIAGKIKRLIIAAPPRVGKSELVSIKTPAFILGKMPRSKIMASSHTADLALHFSRKLQRLIQSPNYASIFPGTKLRSAFPANRIWKQTDHEFDIVGFGDNYKCRGVGGGFPGRGADFLFVDDPIRNRRDANSVVIRQSIWDWFVDDLETRLDSNGGILVMATRWHEDDLSGRLISRVNLVEGEEDIEADDEDSEKWVVLNLPARLDSEAERTEGDPRAIGDPLWPWLWAGRRDNLSAEEMRVKALRKLERLEKKNPWGFRALFQGKPSSPSGNFFQVDKIKIVKATKLKRVATVRYWDKANSKDTGTNSQTAGGRMSILEDGTFLIEDSIAESYDPATRNRMIRNTAKMDGVNVRVFHEQEGGSGGKESAETTNKQMAGFLVEAHRPTGDKVARAEPLAEQCAAGNVMMLEGEWNAPLIEQMRHFPLGKRKDRVDSLTGAFNKLTLDETGYDLLAMVGNDDD